MDDIFREIEHYGKYAENLRQMMNEAQSMIPARVEGRDKRRVALIVLAADGLPGTVRIESDWARKTKSEYLGEAVVNAFQSAVLARMETWSRELASSGWNARAERFVLDLPASGKGRCTSPCGASRTDLVGAAVLARSIEVIAEDSFRAFDRAENPQPVPESTGTSTSRRVHLTLRGNGNGGLTDCYIDANWAVGRSSGMLNRDLAEALEQARAALETSEDGISLSQEMDSLFGELLTLIRVPRNT